jgi:hypothetical protein
MSGYVYDSYAAVDPYQGYGQAYAVPAYPAGAVPAGPAEELRTIFITGFPLDVKERELNNLLRFLPGYEVSEWPARGGNQRPARARAASSAGPAGRSRPAATPRGARRAQHGPRMPCWHGHRPSARPLPAAQRRAAGPRRAPAPGAVITRPRRAAHAPPPPPPCRPAR